MLLMNSAALLDWIQLGPVVIQAIFKFNYSELKRQNAFTHYLNIVTGWWLYKNAFLVNHLQIFKRWRFLRVSNRP